jgi:alpha-tubulin suppressor-like RCC1 family protein
MPNQFFSPEGDLENYFVTDYWLIDQYVGDQLWTWGRNDFGQLAINISGGTTNNRSTPVTTFAGGNNWSKISGGADHYAGIKSDGTLWTWGYGSFGRLGNNSTTDRSTPVTTFTGGTNWKQVHCGGNYTAAIKTDGTLWTWGRNSYGALGINNTTNRSTPVTTFAGGTNWKQVTGGNFYTAAVKTDGTLWLWGDNFRTQLGINNVTDALTPVTTFAGGTNWKSVSCIVSTTIAIKTDGTLWVWGRNQYGQLGINNTLNRSTPVTTFAGGNNWKSTFTGGGPQESVAAIKTDGTLWVWGRNHILQLGINNTTNRSTPVTTFAGGTNWKYVDVSYSHTAAVKTDGTLWTWGRNQYAQLGINNTLNRSTPVTTFAGGTDWKTVAIGDSTIALKAGINAEYPLS